MNINYFKTDTWGDCYVGLKDYMKIIALNKDSTFCMADDENMLEGVCKILKMREEDYKLMLEASKSGDRKKVLGIAKKIHRDENNKKILKDPYFKERIFSFTKRNNPNIAVGLMEEFQKKQPILE